VTKYTAVIDWADGDVSDSDEVVVTAKTAAGATSAARAAWSRTVQPKWPSCRIEKVWILKD